jgi:hypothetical protein
VLRKEKTVMPEPNEATPVTPPKITFSAEQQTKVDELIRESMGRAGNEARATAARLEAEAVVLRAELAALRGDRSGLEKESKNAKAELAKVKKQAVIAEAASRHGFVDVGQVSKLTADEIVLDADKNQFHVVGEDGKVRVGLDGSTPINLDTYFSEFAAKNSHLVRSTVRPGIGSSTDARPHSPQTDIQKLKAIFGKGSDSRKANEIGVNNPQLYKQMRREARALGIIP